MEPGVVTTGIDAYAISPNDGAPNLSIPTPIRMIIVTTGGAIKFIAHSGVERTVTFPAGTFPIAMKKIFLNGTTASGLIGIV